MLVQDVHTIESSGGRALMWEWEQVASFMATEGVESVASVKVRFGPPAHSTDAGSDGVSFSTQYSVFFPDSAVQQPHLKGCLNACTEYHSMCWYGFTSLLAQLGSAGLCAACARPLRRGNPGPAARPRFLFRAWPPVFYRKFILLPLNNITSKCTSTWVLS